MLGYRELSEGTAKEWCLKWKAATESTTDREGAMAAAAAEVESHLWLVGCTGLEDRLQDGVPEAIEHIKQAGVKVNGGDFHAMV